MLYYTILYYTILYYTNARLYYNVMYNTILYYTILHYNTSYYAGGQEPPQPAARAGDAAAPGARPRAAT